MAMNLNQATDTVTPSTGTLNVSGAVVPTTAVAVANGGTGQTTASAGFNAISPITTTGDLIIGNGTNSATRLAIGTNAYVLTSNGTTATWAAAGGGGGGTVTSITAGSGLSGGTITTSGTVALDINGLSSTTVAQNDTVPVYHTSTTSNANCLASDIAGLGVGSIGYQTNYYYFPYLMSGSSGTNVSTANTINYVPFFCRQKTTFTRIGIQVTSALGTNARLGIYNAANGIPTSLLLDCGTVSTASIGEKEATISQTLNVGFYFLAVVADANVTVYTTTITAAVAGYSVGQQTRTATFFSYSASNGSITLPSTATSLTTMASALAISLRVV